MKHGSKNLSQKQAKITWTYNASVSTDRDKIRLLIGDTDTTDQLLSDEEIDFVITQQPNVYYAAAQCCETVAGKFSRDVSTTLEGMSIAKRQRFENYLNMANNLRVMAMRALPSKPFAASIDKDDRDAYSHKENTNLVQPNFDIEMHYHPEGEGRRGELYDPGQR